jgi:hypothetical protein
MNLTCIKLIDAPWFFIDDMMKLVHLKTLLIHLASLTDINEIIDTLKKWKFGLDSCYLYTPLLKDSTQQYTSLQIQQVFLIADSDYIGWNNTLQLNTATLKYINRWINNTLSD